MDQDLKKELERDSDGLLTYEYIANHIGLCDDIMDELIDNMILVDGNGQFVVSAARYLNAIDREHYSGIITRLVASAIEKDRERRDLPSHTESRDGPDAREHAAELSATDTTGRRISKRLCPTTESL